MIRCIPVDGSAPFEVENDTAATEPLRHPSDGYPSEQVWFYAHSHKKIVVDVTGAHCTIESWRERAERFEKELADLRQQVALEAIDKRRESEHG